jgi:hypothetical protein
LPSCHQKKSTASISFSLNFINGKQKACDHASIYYSPNFINGKQKSQPSWTWDLLWKAQTNFVFFSENRQKATLIQKICENSPVFLKTKVIKFTHLFLSWEAGLCTGYCVNDPAQEVSPIEAKLV